MCSICISINTATSQQQQLRQEPRNSVLSPTVVKRRDVNTKTTARSSAANLLLISYETSIICRRFSPLIWKTVNNVPYLLLTHFWCFQDKNPSAIHHSSHKSFLTTLHISIPFLVLLCHFEMEESELCQNQYLRCRCTTVGLQWEQDVLFSHACWILWVFLFHRVYPASRASLLQLASASFTANQSVSKV